MPLSQTQLETYARDGYILLSGLIPDNIANTAEQAMWDCMQAQPDDRATWPDSNYAQGHDRAEIIACYTDDFLQAAAELCGDPLDSTKIPGGALAINIFPSQAPWQTPSPHIDHAIKEHGHKVFPRPFRVATMIFFNDVAERGGGTAVWPGSHRQIEALARSDEERYEDMWALNQDLAQADLRKPLVLTPRRGDVLFYDYLCAHAGSGNISPQPRLALNYKW